MKTIGVLGGLGPQATMDFEARVHRVAQQHIPQRGNSGYPPMIVYYHRFAPVLLTDAGLPQLPLQPDPRLFDAVKPIGAMADFLVITSNTPHLFQEQIEQATGCHVLSMIDITLAEVRRRHWRTVGVLGLGDPLVYTQRLAQLSIAYEIIDAELRAALDQAILGLMEGRDSPASAAIARSAVAALRTCSVDGIILGCTEIPLLLHADADAPDLINPAQLLAEAAVHFALAES